MPFLLLIVAVVGGLGWWGNSLSVTASKEASLLVAQLTTAYLTVADQAIANQVIQRGDVEIDLSRIEAQLLSILQPKLEAIIGSINANTLSGIKVTAPVREPVFANVATLAESFYKQQKPLTSDEEARLQQALRTAVTADLQLRRLRLG